MRLLVTDEALTAEQADEVERRWREAGAPMSGDVSWLGHNMRWAWVESDDDRPRFVIFS